ncbi:MAG TPA: hypothetical protein VHX88_06295 [Solirubrobacteraceae bacterium]|jgi:uncharacterized delta-60 repeat protein|nr:hypothetical protein [Solirubrobacteraceae bacterium]
MRDIHRRCGWISLAAASLIAGGAGATATAAIAQTNTTPGRVAFSLNGGSVLDDVDGGAIGGSLALPNDEVVLAGGTVAQSSSFVVAELEQNGTLDPSFGKGGIARVNVPISVLDVLREPDGKLLVVGGGKAASPLNLPALEVVRLNSNGSLDTTYASDGVATTALQEGCACSNAVVTPQGELLLVGATGSDSPAVAHNPNAPSNFRWALQELTGAGTADASFGTNGVATIGSGNAVGTSVAQLADGEIITDGQVGQPAKLTLAALTPTGAEDPAYAGGNPVTASLPGSFDMLVQPDGTVTLVSDTTKALARYTPQGTLDTSFGSNGQVTVPYGGGRLLAGPGSDVLYVSSPQGLAALDGSPRQRTLSVEGITSTGTVDPAQPATTLALPFGGGSAGGPLNANSFDGALLRRSDGSYLAVGTVGVADVVDNLADGYSIYDFAAAAFTPSLAPDPTFGTTPPALRVSARVPSQRRAGVLRERGVRVSINASAAGLAQVTVRSAKGVIAQGVPSILRTGARSQFIPLTKLGRRLLEAGHSPSVTVRVTARDLSAVSRSASARGRIR